MITRTPIMITEGGIKGGMKGDESWSTWSYTYEEANERKRQSVDGKHRYIKGLGSLREDEYDRIINDPVYDVVTVDDVKYFEMMFGKNSDLRKEFMYE